MNFVSIAQTAASFSALRDMVLYASGKQPFVDGTIAHWQHKELCLAGDENARAAFHAAVAEIDRWVVEDHVTILVSHVQALKMNPLNPGMDGLLAALILTFPEVRWLFGTIRGYGGSHDKNLDEFSCANGLHHIFQPWQTPLFDGFGLREWVRSCAREDAGKSAKYLPQRSQWAVAVDEESDYAYLHAYTAYRFGFRAMALTRCKTVEAILGENARASIPPPDITLEDLYLNFPDGHPGHDRTKRMSNLQDRHEVLPILSTAQYRILITSGHRAAGEDDKHQANQKYIAAQKAAGRYIHYLYKPHGGIFSVWRESKLNKKLSHGIGKGYQWPPDWKAIDQHASSDHDDEIRSHSSPGVLLQIARYLITRAERILSSPINTVEEAVRGTVLATDALEMLGGKTPTSAAEALALKHQFALHAECQFVGVEHRIQLKDRFKEIERDAKSIAYWFRRKNRAQVVLNIQADIINRLVSVLRKYNQFDEELECISRVRHLQNTIFMKSKPWCIIFWPFLRYSEFLLTSFTHFMAAIFVWVSTLLLLVRFNSHMPYDKVVESVVNAFFAANPIAGQGALILTCSTIAVLAGLAHLGIFISHLYVLVSKR